MFYKKIQHAHAPNTWCRRIYIRCRYLFCRLCPNFRPIRPLISRLANHLHLIFRLICQRQKIKNAIITVCFIKKNLARACAKNLVQTHIQNLVQTHIHNVQRYILQILSKFQAGQTSNKPSSEPSTLNFSAYL